MSQKIPKVPCHNNPSQLHTTPSEFDMGHNMSKNVYSTPSVLRWNCFYEDEISREEDFARRRFLEKKILREEYNSSRIRTMYFVFRSYKLTGIDWLIQSAESINRFESIDWKKIFKILSLLESRFYIFVVYGTCVHAHKSLSRWYPDRAMFVTGSCVLIVLHVTPPPLANIVRILFGRRTYASVSDENVRIE